MKPFGHTRPGEACAPKTEVLPDGRKRIVRYFELANKSEIPSRLDLDFGLLDDGDTPIDGWDSLRLVAKTVDDDPPGQKGKDSRPLLLLTYEELPATAEQQVGNNTLIQLEDGRAGVEANFLQLVAGTYVPGTVGATTAPGDASAYLKDVRNEDDGTLRHIKRTYVHGGIISTDDQSLNGGALLKKTIVSVKDVPSTPSGFTLVGSPVQSPGGLPVYTYSYAKGNGEVARRFTNGQGGATNFDPSSPTSSTGPVRCVIEFLTDVSVTSDPTTPPASFKRIGIDHEDRDGHRAWTVTFGYGTGIVSAATSTAEGGKLVLYDQVEFNPSGSYAPSTPSATIGGTVTRVSQKKDPSDGFFSYTTRWAEGFGEVDRATEYASSPDQGTTGISRITIKNLTAPGASDPTTAPSGFGKTAIVPSAQDGYILWTVTCVKGQGTIDSAKQISNGGKLVVYSIAALGTAPSAPSATIGGTVTAIGTGARNGSRTEDGTIVYDYRWAEGQGEATRRFTNSQGGATDFDPAAPTSSKGPVRCTIEFLTATSVTTDPTTPPSSFKRVMIDHEDRDGYRVWTVTFGYGAGLIVDDKTIRNNGKLYLYHRVQLGSAPSAPSASISGTVNNIKDDVHQEDGYQVYDYEWAEGQGVISTRYEYYPGYLRKTILRIFNTSSDLSAFVPSGAVVVNQESEEVDGATLYSLEFMLSADDEPAGDGYITYQKWMPFRYPGQAKLYSETVGGGGLGTVTAVELFLSPPIEVLVLATVSIIYSKSQAVGTLGSALWNPAQYATLRAKFANSSGPRSIVRGLEGYTAVGTSTTLTGSDGGSATISVLGERIFPSASYSVTISGGPAMPDGSTVYTLHAEVDDMPAFVDFNTADQWFRHTIITAQPAALTALPV